MEPMLDDPLRDRDDPFRSQTEAYALGSLEGEERIAFERHLLTCVECASDVGSGEWLLALLPKGLTPAPPPPTLRMQLLDLTDAPAVPIDVRAYTWDEVVPGIKLHVLKEDPTRGLRACLVWALPGARHPRHRHLGDENILVLQGAIKDERGVYGPGQICRSLGGSSHSEQAMPGQDCICYVTYYGDLEMLE
jgi:anti-sigma factor ChrR (cupin superfamily)